MESSVYPRTTRPSGGFFGGRIVVIDPRRTRTAREADEHHFVRPGTDALLLAALAATLFEETEESRARRTVLAAEMKSMPQPRFKGRPTKKTRRDYEAWLRQSDDE